MPLTSFLQRFRQKVAKTGRANLLQSTEIVRCCRIIVQEVHSTEFVNNDKNFGSVKSALNQAENALEAAIKKSDVCEAFKKATNSIVEVGQIMQLDSVSMTFFLYGNLINSGTILQLLDIEERMNNAKNKDEHVEYQSLCCGKRLKNLARSSAADKSPRIDIDVRLRRDIDDESKQELIEVRGKGNDTLDIVLLSMKLNKRSALQQNLHFYDRTFPGAIKDLITQRNHRLEPLPFNRVLSEIPRLSDRLVLYCLHDHESGNYLILRCQSPRSFTNLWKITLNSAFVLKDVFGIIEHAERSTDVSHAEVRITKKQVSSEFVREERRGVWPELLREVHKSFGTASNICWTIEAPDSSGMPSKLTIPKPKLWLPESSSTRASITPTLIVPPLPSVAYVAKKGKPGRSSWFTALVEKFNV
ncbi:hypothetical protein EV421DRAFT_1779100 [Armillaria borealis]|uniref:Uncharacterized protein n=1 Tax=Armillaria borealis TaxID=47425 RepID=A0AA39MXD5_9AGAR|nr:hypothetical protein EV421DRAFT_1779100 [Armillaria borealis]